MIYLDNNATTPCAPQVVEAMSKYWSEYFGNPSSPHFAGKIAAKAVAKARAQLASLAHCEPSEIVFTSGATESNNLVFLGLLLEGALSKKKIVTTPIEHKSVLNPAQLLGEKGFNIVYLPVDSNGVVDLDAASELIDTTTVLVSVQVANNEIGTIQPVRELAEIANGVGAVFHTDAAQGLGKIPLDLTELNVDLASFSAHKIYGPKGVGALYVKNGPSQWPWVFPLRGGGQEGGLRPGTLNVPGIVGFGEAARLAGSTLENQAHILLEATKKIENILMEELPDCVIHSRHVPRIPGLISVAIPGVPADMIADNLMEYCVGFGSACNGGTLGESHVLKAINCGSSISSKNTIRISFGLSNNIDYMLSAILKFSNTINNLREIIEGVF